MKRAVPLLLVALAACSGASKVPVAAEPTPIPAAPVVVSAPIAAPATPPPDTPVTNAPDRPAPSPLRPFTPSANCQFNDCGDWTAHIDAMPGPDARPRLIVTGTLATKPAARLELRLEPAVLESNPPQLMVDLVVRLPTEPSIDSRVRKEVRGEWPVTPPIAAVHINCGGRRVATISPIEVAR